MTIPYHTMGDRCESETDRCGADALPRAAVRVSRFPQLRAIEIVTRVVPAPQYEPNNEPIMNIEWLKFKKKIIPKNVQTKYGWSTVPYT